MSPKNAASVPYGQVVAASGASVRVTLACSAGLATELPIWGLKMHMDADWVVRAMCPVGAVVLREGEHALVQAHIIISFQTTLANITSKPSCRRSTSIPPHVGVILASSL